MDTKPGFKTASFWLAALATVVTFLLGSDVLGGGRDVQVGALILNALAAVGYTTLRTYAKKDGEKRPSWKTTEFWLSSAAALCAVLYATGSFGPGTDAGKILGVVIGILTAAGYGLQTKASVAKAGE